MSQNKTDLPDQEPNSAATDTPENAAAQAANTEGHAPSAAADNAAGAYAEEAARAQDDVETEAAEELDDLDSMRQALALKADEAERNRDQALRAKAEADNVRKRAQRDVEAARKFALEKFAGELLGVRDSLEMGLKASAEEQADLDKVVEGMELTNRMLAGAMEKFGVEVVNPEGEIFDPEVHEAVSMQPTDAQEPNTVATVVQKGYTLNGRVLRAAMVVVAQAPNQ